MFPIKSRTVAAIALSAITAFTWGDSKAEGESFAVLLLKELNAREKLAYEKYERAIEADEIDQIKKELQSIIDGYESLISRAPDYAPAYVSYGLMLNRTGNVDESYAMFLKADQLDPEIPVVKNQLGNYMAESGRYAEAYGFFLLARDLDPKQSLYDYQIGSILVAFRRHFIADDLYDPMEIDQRILDHFRAAMRNSPRDSSFRMRYAQAFFDIEYVDWEEALKAWQELYKFAGSEYEQQIVRLYTARVRFEMGHHQAARRLLRQIDHPTLEESKRVLENTINERHPR